jgi:hypothetical protein
MKLLLGDGSTPIALTDATDLPIDRANTYPAGNPPPDCNISSSTIPLTTRDNGGVVIQITGTGATTQPDLSVILGATGVGTPITSYGWFRFTTKVDP